MKHTFLNRLVNEGQGWRQELLHVILIVGANGHFDLLQLRAQALGVASIDRPTILALTVSLDR